MLLKCILIADGPGPSEAVARIESVDNRLEEVVLSKKLVQNGQIDIGSPLLSEENRVLVELPREAVSGRWRIWVPRSQVVSLEAAE